MGKKHRPVTRIRVLFAPKQRPSGAVRTYVGAVQNCTDVFINWVFFATAVAKFSALRANFLSTVIKVSLYSTPLQQLTDIIIIMVQGRSQYWSWERAGCGNALDMEGHTQNFTANELEHRISRDNKHSYKTYNYSQVNQVTSYSF